MPIMQEAVSRNLMPVNMLFESDPDWKDKRDRAIRKLFNGDSAEFTKFCMPIDGMENWKDALEYIESEFTKRKIKSDSKEATGLTDVLFKRYFPSY